jgi:hypothetical protein
MMLTETGSFVHRIRAAVVSSLLLGLGIAIVLVPFNVLCVATAGRLYPEYPSMARNWSLGCTYGGEFVAASPAIRPDPERLPGLAQFGSIMTHNVHAMLSAVTDQMGAVLLFVVVGLAAFLDKRKEPTYWFCLGVAFLIGHAAAFYWLPLEGERRYPMYVTAFWYPLGIAGLTYMLSRIRLPVRAQALAAMAVWVVVSIPAIWELAQLHARDYRLPESSVTQLQEFMSKCQGLVGTDDLVAVSSVNRLICGAMFLDRPVVALPCQAMNTEENMHRFVEIFRPRLIIAEQRNVVWSIARQFDYEPYRVQWRENGFADVLIRRK